MLAISTPMLCALLLRSEAEEGGKKPGKVRSFFIRITESAWNRTLVAYAHSLDWALASKGVVVAVLLAVIALNVYLFNAIPKGYFPQQDNGQLNAGLRADQSISSAAVAEKLRQAVDIIRKDPAVDTVVGFSGGGCCNRHFQHISGVLVSLTKSIADTITARIFKDPIQSVNTASCSLEWRTIESI